VVVAIMLFLDVLGYRTRIAGMYVGAIMLGVYTDGWLVKNSVVTYSVTQLQTNSTFFTTFTIDPNLWTVIIAVLILVSFLLTYYELGSAK
jgi:hypothetical protein